MILQDTKGIHNQGVILVPPELVGEMKIRPLDPKPMGNFYGILFVRSHYIRYKLENFRLIHTFLIQLLQIAPGVEARQDHAGTHFTEERTLACARNDLI
ncbi:MAG TPA: hypothetical protein VGU90_07340, partial [Terriglobales bacterium]|nr:hypothetical protein [Terriglobales bacterium]